MPLFRWWGRVPQSEREGYVDYPSVGRDDAFTVTVASRGDDWLDPPPSPPPADGWTVGSVWGVEPVWANSSGDWFAPDDVNLPKPEPERVTGPPLDEGRAIALTGEVK